MDGSRGSCGRSGPGRSGSSVGFHPIARLRHRVTVSGTGISHCFPEFILCRNILRAKFSPPSVRRQLQFEVLEFIASHEERCELLDTLDR